jgi:hypothetical protein
MSERELWDGCCRQIADGGAPVEARGISTGPGGYAIRWIYKIRYGNGCRYTGILLIYARGATWQCTVVAAEDDVLAGIREATVTAEILNSGRMSREEFDREWTRQPFGGGPPAGAQGLSRYLSDEEQYDPRFPNHPLSIVRSVLTQLPAQLLRTE